METDGGGWTRISRYDTNASALPIAYNNAMQHTPDSTTYFKTSAADIRSYIASFLPEGAQVALENSGTGDFLASTEFPDPATTAPIGCDGNSFAYGDFRLYGGANTCGGGGGNNWGSAQYMGILSGDYFGAGGTIFAIPGGVDGPGAADQDPYPTEAVYYGFCSGFGYLCIGQAPGTQFKIFNETVYFYARERAPVFDTMPDAFDLDFGSDDVPTDANIFSTPITVGGLETGLTEAV